MSNCLPCTDPIPACQGCTKSQECLQIGRTCTQCPRNICVDSKGSNNGGGGSGPSTGTTAGAAVGGVVGVAVIIAAVWWFWWRPKGLEASRKRYSKHLLNRQSKLAEKRKTQNGIDGNGDVATKRTSVHLRMDEGAHNRRSVATGNLLDGADETVPVSRTSDDDNPFGDQNRSSIGTFGANDDAASTHTSEFSFRSSHSTNIIPIAYIPPHSSSLSVDDAQGRSQPRLNASPAPAIPRRSSMNRASIPTSMASRDSLALAGAEIIELNPLPPVLTPDTPSIPHGTMANGAPIRPPRSPGLDLQLPKTSSPLASPPINSPHLRLSRPPSGFPFSNSNSPTSGSPTSPTYPQHQLLPPASNSNGARGISVLGDQRAGSSQSHLSVMSSFTSRSNNSTMSYILDPPQIITPVNAQGVKRVEFQQAKAHKLGGGGGGGGGPAINSNQSPTSPLATQDPFSDEASISRGGETGSSSRPVSASSRWTSSSLASDDDASEAVQFLQGQSITFTNPNTPASATTTVIPGAAASSAATRGGGGGGGQRGMSTLSVDLPRSARSSQSYSIADDHRQSAWSTTSGSAAANSQGMSRTSTTSSTSRDSLLEGIPFMAPPIMPHHNPSTSSVNLSLPINVTVPVDSPTASRQDLTSPPPANMPSPVTTPTRTSLASLTTTTQRGQKELDEEEEDPLPAPFLPFAGQRPSSSSTTTSPLKSSIATTTGGNGERVQSEQFSVRSGFGSGLSQIPFQLGFPSGFGEGEDDDDDRGRSERGSMMSDHPRWSNNLTTREEEEEEDSGLSRVEEMTERGTVSSAAQSRRQSVKSISSPKEEAGSSRAASALPTPPTSPPRGTDLNKEEEEKEETNRSNPFGTHAEVRADGADPRASMDTLALNAALSANLDAQP